MLHIFEEVELDTDQVVLFKKILTLWIKPAKSAALL